MWKTDNVRLWVKLQIKYSAKNNGHNIFKKFKKPKIAWIIINDLPSKYYPYIIWFGQHIF